MAIVKMTTLECGPNGNFPEGSLREVTLEQGEMLVATRHAVCVDKSVAEQAVAPVAEVAAAPAAEVTAPRKPARR